MTRARLTTAVLNSLLLLLLVATVTGCARRAFTGRHHVATPAQPSMLAPSPASVGLVRSEPAVWAAVAFEQAHCAWDWHETRQTYVAGQQKLATTGYAARLAAASNPVAWREQVIAQKQTVTCTVSDAVRVVDAPTTATTVFVRMAVNTEITSTLGTFAGGQQIASWLVTRTRRGWLVAGRFDGG